MRRTVRAGREDERYGDGPGKMTGITPDRDRRGTGI